MFTAFVYSIDGVAPGTVLPPPPQRRKPVAVSRAAAGSRRSASLLALARCAHAHDPITTRVTWNGDIARIVEARCVRCHSPDGRGPMSLVTYEDARPWAKAIKEEVMTRRMPKWHAVRGYGDFTQRSFALAVRDRARSPRGPTAARRRAN